MCAWWGGGGPPTVGFLPNTPPCRFSTKITGSAAFAALAGGADFFLLFFFFFFLSCCLGLALLPALDTLSPPSCFLPAAVAMAAAARAAATAGLLPLPDLDDSRRRCVACGAEPGAAAVAAAAEPPLAGVAWALE